MGVKVFCYGVREFRVYEFCELCPVCFFVVCICYFVGLCVVAF